MKRPLRELSRGDVFRTADGLLWRRASAYPTVRGEMATCSAVADPSGPRDFRTDTLVEPLDLPALLTRHADLEKENAELRAVLHDLWQDRTAARAGAELERGAAVAELAAALEAASGAVSSHADRYVRGFHDGRLKALSNALYAVRARGPTRPPVPPCALEGAVREAVGLLEGARITVPNGIEAIAYRHAQVAAALARLRAALGEGEAKG